MSNATFSISAFGDEIADDLEKQLHTLNDLAIRKLELRGVWGKNVLALSDDEVQEVGRACTAHGIHVSCIGSPVGKTPIHEPLAAEETNLLRSFTIARQLGVDKVRIFSFYPPEDAGFDGYLDESVRRLHRLTELAAEHEMTLLLENERGIVGDTVERCRALLDAVDHPRLQFIWDPANFVIVGEADVTDRGWDSLGGYTHYVHVKDARLADGSIHPAGEGDGQIPELLTRLKDTGRHITLALEPHLAMAGERGGFSDVAGMTRAAQALRAVMQAAGCTEDQEA